MKYEEKNNIMPKPNRKICDFEISTGGFRYLTTNKIKIQNKIIDSRKTTYCRSPPDPIGTQFIASKLDKLNFVGTSRNTGKEAIRKISFIFLETSFLSINVYTKYRPNKKKSVSNILNIAQENINKALSALFHKMKSKISHKEKNNVIPSKHFEANKVLFLKKTKRPKSKERPNIKK